MPTGTSTPAGERPGLASFLRERRDHVLAAWRERVRDMPPARRLDRGALDNHLPELLDRIADMVEALEHGHPSGGTGDAPDEHAFERLSEGYDLDQVVHEYAELRECVLDLWAHEPGRTLGAPLLNRAIDEAVAAAVTRYTQARDRTIEALDRISTAAFESADLEALLAALGRVLLETTVAVDSVAIFLVEGDRVRLRAAVGLEAESFTAPAEPIPLDDRTCVGVIAMTRAPLELRDASNHPLVLDELRRQGAHAFYGVPMLQGDRLVGVAHMASRTAWSFSSEDKLLFRAMVDRAAIALHHQRIVAERRDAESSRDVALEILERGPSSLVVDPDFRIQRMNAAAERLTGLQRHRVLGRRLWEVWPQLDPPCSFGPAFRRAMRTRVPATVEDLFEPYGVWMDVSCIPTRDGGLALLAYDVTVRRRAAHERQALLERERAARLEAERALSMLRESEERFRTLADNVVQLAWMANEKGELFWFNRRWFEFTGLTAEETFSGGWLGTHHPAHRERVLGHFNRCIATGERWEDTFPLRRHDGTWRWFLSRAVPIRDESGRIVRWFGTNTDVTEVLETQERMRFLDEATVILTRSLDYRKNLHLLGALAVPRLADAVAFDLVNADGLLERVEVSATDEEKARLLAELVRRFPPLPTATYGPARVLALDRSQLVEKIDETHLAGFVRGPEHRALVDRIGMRSYVGVPLRARGRTLGTLNFYVLSSERRFTDKDLQLAEDLAHRASLAIDNAMLHERERHAVRVRDEFLATASHDLRSPLTTLALQTEKLRRRLSQAGDEPLGNDWLRPRMEAVVHNVNRIRDLLEDLLDVSRIHAGRLSLRLEPLDFAGVARDVVARMRPLYEERGMPLTLHAPEPLPMQSDRLRLEQLMTNLLSNALKYGADKPVDVTVTAAGDRVRLSVRDRGIGIGPEDLPRLFRSFERFGDTTREQGTGLGLWIVKRIVDALGGEVRVESAPGKGSTFTLELPR